MRSAFLLLAASALALAAPALSVTPAAAASGPTLGCNIQPSETSAFTGSCGTNDTTTSYTVEYLVQGTTGTPSFAWTVPSGGTVASGCTSASDECAISVHHGESDQDLTASVTVTQGGTSTTLSSTAIINATCGKFSC